LTFISDRFFFPPQGKQKQKETTGQTLTPVQQQIKPKRNYTQKNCLHSVTSLVVSS